MNNKLANITKFTSEFRQQFILYGAPAPMLHVMLNVIILFDLAKVYNTLCATISQNVLAYSVHVGKLTSVLYSLSLFLSPSLGT